MPEGPGSNLGKDTKIFQYFFSCFDSLDFMHIFFLSIDFSFFIFTKKK